MREHPYVLALVAGAGLLAVLVSGCRTPLFVDPSPGSLLPKGGVEIRPGFSCIQYENGDDSGTETRNYGISAAFGTARVPLIGCRAQAALRFEFADHDNPEIEDWFYLGWQGHFGISQWVSLSLSSTANWRENSFDCNLLDLGLHGTIPLADVARLNLSGRVIPHERDMGDSEDPAVLFAINGSVSLSSDHDRWVVTPAVAYLIDPDEHFNRLAWALFFSIKSGT